MNIKIFLYHIEDCPYCHLVRRKLDFLGLDYVSKAVPHEGAQRAELIEKTGQQAVPALIDGDKVITDSLEIIAYLDQAYGPVELPGGDYGMATEVAGEYDAVREKTIAALKEVGFGLLTEIDVKATMKKKLDKDLPPYGILGFCNPGFAYHGISNEPNMGLLLPCNVIVRELAPGRFLVSAAHPVKMFVPVGRPEMLGMAQEVTALLKKAIESL
ncbi:MAG: DUF302 domain-containing protein [bacterium]|nr:DUF302 domain-containing protein [bacterium]